jgi:hypothetical protein
MTRRWIARVRRGHIELGEGVRDLVGMNLSVLIFSGLAAVT